MRIKSSCLKHGKVAAIAAGWPPALRLLHFSLLPRHSSSASLPAFIPPHQPPGFCAPAPRPAHAATYFLYMLPMFACMSLSPPTGGYLLGTVPDGRRVVGYLGDKEEYHKPLLKLYKRWEVGVGQSPCCRGPSLEKRHNNGTTSCKAPQSNMRFESFVKAV